MGIDGWIARKIGLAPGTPLTRAALDAWQEARKAAVLAYVREHSAFYRERLAGMGAARWGELPFTTPDDLAREGARMVCVPGSRVDRIVTLPTTGTTGAPKRVYFTEADQELMTDYIHHGLRVMVEPGDVFLTLMPCERPGSVGDLVSIGVERIGARAVRVGALPPDGSRDDEALAIMRREGVTTGLATAPTAARLARKSAEQFTIRNAQRAKHDPRRPLHDAQSMAPRLAMRTMLLSAQYIADEDKRDIEALWSCKVFEHYGMTEMGLGGAMACAVREGYHPREADLFFEIVDPVSGRALGDGEPGEIVFTTLTRAAMPLIRYRTGDISRFIPAPCPCGSVLRRIAKVGDRMERKPY